MRRLGRKIMNQTLILGLAALATVVPAQAQVVGVNAAIRNTVQMKTVANPALHRAVLKERVGLGDDIATGQASVLQILLLDRTSFTVGANARVKIDRFVYDPNRQASAVGASIAKGAFRFMSGKATHGMPGQSSVKTPVASIGIRGTMFEGAVGADAVRIARGESAVGAAAGADDDTATLIVLRGPGAGALSGETPGAIDVTANGQTVAVERAGLALFVPGPNAAPIGPFQLSDAGLAALHDLLRTTPTRRNRKNNIDFAGNPIIDRTFECSGEFFLPFDPAQGPTAGPIRVAGGCGIQ
jgi:hypothetical protein